MSSLWTQGERVADGLWQDCDYQRRGNTQELLAGQIHRGGGGKMAKAFDIFVNKSAAFIQITPKFMLCIGTKGEVEHADAEKIAYMIEQALAFSQFRQIINGIGRTKH